MGKKKTKVKEKCCGKYLKKGKHCKDCPLLLKEPAQKKTDNKAKDTKEKKQKKSKKKKQQGKKAKN